MRYTAIMQETNRKKRSVRNPKSQPPQFSYPRTPHLVGMDWIELPVPDPALSAELLMEIGFTPRGYVGKYPLVAVGGTVYMLTPTREKPLLVGPARLTIQVTTDNIKLKRQQLLDIGVRPTALKRQPRGDMTFTLRWGLDYVLRFTGPVRE